MGLETIRFPDPGSLNRAELIPRDKLESETELLKTHKISPSEYQTILKILGRLPTMAELGIFSAMWSEHCSYKSSRVHLKRLPTEGEQVVVGPGENAGIVRLSGKLCAAFKMESHNHPSYIEPYQGAATGVGGILRDVFCMGARPVANLNCLRFGRREHPRTHYLFENVVKGIGDYGNCIGIPTVAGTTSFHSSYDGNCLVNAMTVGLIHEDRIFKGYASGKGNFVIYVGSATGRDGIHGATMASDSFDSSEVGSSRTTVQVGDPFAEKLLLEATLELLDKDLVIGLQDMGAAGLTSSSFEMADRAGSGLYLELDRVPVRAQNMSAYELLLSESQERMLLVVEPDKWPAIEACLNRWELSFDVIGYVTDSGRVQIGYQGRLEVDVPVAPLAGMAPLYDRPRQTITSLADREPRLRENLFQQIQQHGLTATLSRLIQETGAKDVIYRQYDHHIGTKTVLGPEAQGAGVLWLRSEWSLDEPYLGLAVAASCNERYCGVDPFVGGSHAVLKSARVIAATGAVPLAVTDCLNFGNPEVPEVMEEFAQAVDGIGEACRELNTPVVSGNVSLYNTTDGRSILPTPMIGMIGKHADIRFAIPAVMQGSEGVLALLAPKTPQFSFGGSLLSHVLGDSDRQGQVPSIDWNLERLAMATLRQWILAGNVKAARDVGEGGILTVLTKMCLAGSGGVSGQLAESKEEMFSWYFGELGPAYVLQFAGMDEYEKAKNDLQETAGLRLYKIGKCHSDRTVVVDDLVVNLDQLDQAYENSLRF